MQGRLVAGRSLTQATLGPGPLLRAPSDQKRGIGEMAINLSLRGATRADPLGSRGIAAGGIPPAYSAPLRRRAEAPHPLKDRKVLSPNLSTRTNPLIKLILGDCFVNLRLEPHRKSPEKALTLKSRTKRFPYAGGNYGISQLPP